MRLRISISPHIQQPRTTRSLMGEVLIALSLPTAGSIYFFGLRALSLISICIISCVASEYLVLRIRKKTDSTNDLSAVVTGLLLALILPPSIQWYAAVLGSVFAMVVGKHLFGGLGANIFNPALIARAFLMATYPSMLNIYIAPGTPDAVTSATPLALHKFESKTTALIDLLSGNTAGSLGETSAILLLIGGAYLLIRKAADWRIPFAIMISFGLLSVTGYFLDTSLGSPLFHICSGGFLIGVLFMATDPVTTPITKKGAYLFGAACGFMIIVLRYYCALPEGVMYSILFMNALTPLINRYTKSLPFGVIKEKLKAEELPA